MLCSEGCFFFWVEGEWYILLFREVRVVDVGSYMVMVINELG